MWDPDAHCERLLRPSSLHTGQHLLPGIDHQHPYHHYPPRTYFEDIFNRLNLIENMNCSVQLWRRDWIQDRVSGWWGGQNLYSDFSFLSSYNIPQDNCITCSMVYKIGKGRKYNLRLYKIWFYINKRRSTAFAYIVDISYIPWSHSFTDWHYREGI